MPLFLTKYNPHFPDPDKPTLDADFCLNTYCHLVQDGDIVNHQYYQTPCGQNEITDPDFSGTTLGADIILNGDFTGNANGWFAGGVEVGATACPATVDAWCYNINKVGHDGAAANVTPLTQVPGLVTGTFYKVTYTVSGRTSGDITCTLGDGAGATIGSTNETNGTFIEVLWYDDTDDIIQFTPSATFDGSLDDIIVEPLTYNSWDIPGGVWEVDTLTGAACKVATGLDSLEESVAAYTTVNGYYSLAFTVTVVQGSVVAYVANVTDQDTTTISASGDYTLYYETGVTGVVKFTPSADFIGCISSPDLRELKNDIDFSIKNDAQEIEIADAYITYYHEFITIQYDPLDDGLTYGCWVFNAYDTCTVQYDNQIVNPTMTGGSGLTAPTGWFTPFGNGQITWNSDKATFINPGGLGNDTGAPFIRQATPITLLDGNYEATFDITLTAGVTMTVSIPNTSFSQTYNTSGSKTFTITGFVGNPNLSYSLRFTAGFAAEGADVATVDNVTLMRTEPFDATYTSECVKYEAAFPNTKLIIGYSDSNNFGFEFVNTNFKLKQRIAIRAFGSQYPTDDQEYTYSTGTRARHYAKTEKLWGLYTDPISETAHDTLRLQSLCEHFIIGDDESATTEYLALGEYQPEWSGTGSYSVAVVRFDLRIKTAGTKFLRNC